jgi:chemotaxis protein methyltransferase WspC
MVVEQPCGIETLLADEIGLDPVSVGPRLILRAAQRRMNELHIEDPGAYERLVHRSESERQALIDQVVVSESWFFRDERPFQWLKEYVREHWLKDLLRPPLRALSLGCASGEEPYSIAVALFDIGLPARRFEIDAVDISARCLAAARAGVYTANSFRGTDLGYRVRYFHECHRAYELDPTVRSTVKFLHANVLDGSLLAGSQPYDVLFCRNVLIYLNAHARASLVSVIDRLLALDGLVFVGHADCLDRGDIKPRFTAVGPAGLFAYRRSTADDAGWSRPQLPAPPAVLALNSPRAASIAQAPGRLSSGLDGIGQLREGEPQSPRYAEAAPQLLDQATALANRGHFDQALAACEQHLRHKGLAAPVYFLMGMICQAAGKTRRAEECLHKAVYLDPRHDEALLALALLAERRLDHDAAAGFRRRAERTVVMMRKKVD